MGVISQAPELLECEIRITLFGYPRDNFAGREPMTLAPAVGRDLGKWRFAQRFLVVPW
jgi:hypothetical protein